MNQQLFLSLLFLLCPLLSISFHKISKIKLATAQNIQISCTVLATQSQTIPTQKNIDILGRAAYYAVLAGSAITVIGPTKLIGSAGVYPTGSLSGNQITYVAGAPHVADTYAQNAQLDLFAAYNTILSYPHGDFNNRDLAGQTLIPGVYAFQSSASLNSFPPLTLDAKGDPNAKWVFQIVSTFTAVASAQVNIINGGSSENVYWQVGSSATIHDNVKMVGNIIAFYSITIRAGSNLVGQVLALNGAVSLYSNNINSVDCLSP